MGNGLGNIQVNQKKESGGGGGGIIAAANGLSVDASLVVAVLGNDVGGPPNALFQSDREISTDNHFLRFLGTGPGNFGPSMLFENDQNVSIVSVIHTNPNAGANAKISSAWTNDSAQSVKIGVESSAAANPNRRYVDSGGGMIDIGDVFAVSSGTKIRVNNSGSQISASGQVDIVGILSGVQTLLVKGAAGQSVNIFEVQNSAATVLVLIDQNGRTSVTDFITIRSTDIAFGDLLGTAYATIRASTSKGVKFVDNAANVPFIFEFNSSGTTAFADLNIIRTAAMTGAVGTRGKWKLGSKLTGYTATTDAAEVEIDGVKYYLLMGVAI